MLTGIQSLKGFGIFDEYSRPAGTHDFCDRNIIYGWNYSGKTTLSRLFHALDQRAPHPELAGCRFSLTGSDGTTITEANVAACTKTVRVFNSDFIADSLNWNGGAFRPILLLGEEAKDAQQKIAHFERVISRCAASAANRQRDAQAIDDSLSEAKTAAAKQIKTTLGIVEVFTATHLSQLLTVISVLDDTVHSLPADKLASDLSLANSSAKDQLPLVHEVTFASGAAAVYGTARALFKQRPASLMSIESLRQQPLVASWVGQGLHLHENTDTCAFCLSPFTVERRAELHAHFSRELISHRHGLDALLDEIGKLRFAGVQIREADLNVQFRARLEPLLTALTTAVSNYHGWVDQIEAICRAKLEDQFAEVQDPSNPDELLGAIAVAVNGLNDLIAQSNAITNNFAAEKAAAIRRLKNHYANQFTIDFNTEDAANRRTKLLQQVARFDRAKEQANVKLKEQQARINRAQNGREKINERIVNLLNSSALQIDVVSEGGNDRFILKRNGRIAKHLSEGEKTAIAFAFFLTKLFEEPKLDDVIVYIDDPISSLDSNHIFQVYSILKSTFFKKIPNQRTVATTCKQLFVSTHNYEFFSLLRDLPGEARYFLTKRISSTRSTMGNLPESISRYSSEYHYLFHILHSFDQSSNKADAEHLLALPNAARRFLELYTYAKLPMGRSSKVERRAELLFGAEKANRILKVLHHFSHLESVERLMTNTNAVADIEGAVSLLMESLKADNDHYQALLAAVQ